MERRWRNGIFKSRWLWSPVLFINNNRDLSVGLLTQAFIWGTAKQADQNKNAVFLPGLMSMIYKDGPGIYTYTQDVHLIQLRPDSVSQHSQHKRVLFKLYNGTSEASQCDFSQTRACIYSGVWKDHRWGRLSGWDTVRLYRICRRQREESLWVGPYISLVSGVGGFAGLL